MMRQVHAYTRVRIIEFRYSWSIENFGFLSREPGCLVTSLPFAVPGTETNWCLKLYPGGINPECKDHVSVFLKLLKPAKPEVIANFRLSLERNSDSIGEPLVSGVCNFTQEEYGFPRVVKRDALLQPQSQKEETKTALQLQQRPGDRLTIVCEIELNAGVCDSYDNATALTSATRDDRAAKCQAKLISDIHDVYLKGAMSDVTLLADGREFYAHRVILAARSPTFAGIFLKNPGMSEFAIDDVPSDVMEEILRYLYSGRLLVNDCALIKAILRAALDYEFYDYHLERICEDLMIGQLDVPNATELLMFAEELGLRDLQRAAIRYIVSHSREVTRTPEYQEMVTTKPDLVSRLFCAVTDAESKLAP